MPFSHLYLCAVPIVISRLRYISADFGYQLPKKKDRHHGLESGPDPAGIIKSTWMGKHRYMLPAVTTLVFNWADEHAVAIDWRDKEAVVIAEIERIKDSIKSRQSRLFVVMFCGGPEADASQADEKIASLRRRVEVDPKNIFFFYR